MIRIAYLAGTIAVFTLCNLWSQNVYAQLSGAYPIECALTANGNLTCNTDGACSVSGSPPTFSCDAAGSSRHASASCTSGHLAQGCTAGSHTTCVNGTDYYHCYLNNQALNPSASSVTFSSVMVGTTGTGVGNHPYVVLTSTDPTRTIDLTRIFTLGEFTAGTDANDCGSSLPPLATCTIHMHFSPTAAGTRTGTLVVWASEAGSSIGQVVVALSGTGVDTSPSSARNDLNAGFGSNDRASHRLAFLASLNRGATRSAETTFRVGTTTQATAKAASACQSGLNDNTTNNLDENNGYIAGFGDGNDHGWKGSDGADGGADEFAPPRIVSPNPGRLKRASIANSVATSASAYGTRVGDPVNAAIGNKTELQVDHSGLYAAPMVYSRSYNSLQFASTATIGQLVGVGWRANWDDAITSENNGQTMRISHADGTSYTFSLSSNGTTWYADGSGNIQLVQQVVGGVTTWTLTEGDGTVRTYDSRGRLSTLSKQGFVYALAYDSQKRLASVTNPFGRQLAFAYDSFNRVSQLTDPAGGITQYAYDKMGRLIEVTYPDSRTRGYAYENQTYPDLLTGTIDSDGTRASTTTYDVNGLVASTELGGGVQHTSIVYGQNSSTVTNANGAVFSKQFTVVRGEMLLASETVNCCSSTAATTSYQYNNKGDLTQVTDAKGTQTSYTHDYLGRMTGVTEAVSTSVQRNSTLTWNSTRDLLMQTVKPTQTVTDTYDALGRVATHTVGNSGGSPRTVTYTYNTAGLLASMDGSRTDLSDVVSYTYDALGNMATETDPSGHVTYYNSYNLLGLPLSITYPDGIVEARTYDPRGRVLTDSYVGRTTTYTYDANGLQKTATTPEGEVTTYTYDATHAVMSQVSSTGKAIFNTRNAAGLITRVDTDDDDGNLVTTATTVYDALGRVSQRIDAFNKITTYQYDVNGNVTSITDPNAHTVQFAYDALNRLAQSTDAAGQIVSYSRDAGDRATQITDANGNSTSYTYDAFNAATSTLSPDTGASAAAFDSAGNTASSSDARGQSANSTYDASNRVVSQTLSDGTSIAWTYDSGSGGIGKLASIVDSSGSLAWTYDGNGRPASKTQVVGGITKALSYTRDALGKVQSITYPSGNVLGIQYTQGYLTSMTWNGQAVVSDIQYFPFGAPESWIFGNGAEYTRYTDENGRIWKYLVPGGSQSLAFDNAGRITTLTDDATGRTQTFGYDAVGRLTTFSGFTSTLASETRSYTYDANGNRTMSTENGVWYPYSYAPYSNRLQYVTMLRNNAYDAAGNLTSDGTNSYTYDARGRMISATTSVGTIAYKVNTVGERVSRTNALGSGTIWMHDDSGHIIGEYDAQSGAPVQEFIWLNDTLVAVAGSLPVACGTPPCYQNGIGYIWTDHLGTPRAITSFDGTKIWEWVSAPFGDTLPNKNPSGRGALNFHFRFAGQYADDQTLLNQNWNREYDSALGRYVESDSLGLSGSINLYNYAVSNPLIFADPTGQFVIVTIYTGQDGNVAGHIGIGVNSLTTEFGFDPQPGFGLLAFLNMRVPGAVLIADGHAEQSFIFNTTSEQDVLVANFIRDQANNPGWYQETTRNCVNFVNAALSTAGISCPTSTLPRWFFSNIQNGACKE
jgi:RHS repeat-associated protein